MHRKRITFIIIPPNDGQVQEYRFTSRFLVLAALVCLAFITAFSYYFTGYYSRVDHREDLAQLRAENGELLRSLEHTRTSVSQLEKFMGVLREDDEKLRNYHQMEPLSADERLAGVGGAELPAPFSSALPARKRLLLEDLNASILRLQREAKIQEESFKQLEHKFRESEDGWKHFPTIAPVSSEHAWISSRFGYRSDPFTGRPAFHSGIDFAGRKGTPVYATADGTVREVYRDAGLGNVVVIDHNIELMDDNGQLYRKEGVYQTEYGHLEKFLVTSGQRVVRGQQIGAMGNTGRSTGPHLHYGVLYKDQRMGRRGYVDPQHFILDLSSSEKLAGLALGSQSAE